ncbi:copper ion binding protein [Desulfonatronum thiosulfatophilum]|uniref:Copper ion binding protein n=1 Tax=Desulfonatronum thiosulfatophilum TaxID=617002 RepID=A0A1G6E915_9BACT|nr:heavy-metal-associated domain-containing protein [Desulfonatronum thiosulfatophilum]SDB53893.1 copper ion binding protein [Desulfonatronum thiosulfatophilum]
MATIKVSGMSCQHCVNAVTKALSGIDGVQDVKVSLEKKQADFTETKPVSREVIREALQKAGHDLG